MSLSRILGFVVKKWPYVVMVLGMAVYRHIERYSPRQPDPASGHVYRMISPRRRKAERYVMYLTSTERSLYYGSAIVSTACFFGILGNLYIQKNKRYNSSI
jgi:hypothetical protein